MLNRTTKRLVISSIYVLIILVIMGGSYWSKQPTCNDNIKNGQEEGVDCGMVACGKACASSIQALVVQDARLIKTPIGDYDMAALVYNPNVDYGTDSTDYDLVLVDSTKKRNCHVKNNSFYILPGQTKYIVRPH